MTTAFDTDRLSELDAKLDRLTEQVGYLTARAQEQAEQREMWRELIVDLSPVATEAVATLTAELSTTDLDMAEVTRLLKRLAESAAVLDSALAQLQSAHGLVEDIMPLSGDAVAAIIRQLAELEDRGYFTFVREGLGVVDRVVTTYDADDIRALGDNIVLILDTVKQMTQPEIMTMLRRTVDSIERTDVESASLFRIARQMRDPEVKRGLARLLGVLRTMGGEDPKPPTSRQHP